MEIQLANQSAFNQQYFTRIEMMLDIMSQKINTLTELVKMSDRKITRWKRKEMKDRQEKQQAEKARDQTPPPQ
jgi:hypothetical protein